MTITNSLRDENADSKSITDAIDGLSLAMGGGFRRSVRSTDKAGQVVEITKTTTTGERVGVKKAEREVIDYKNEWNDSSDRPLITWDGLRWHLRISPHSQPPPAQFVFEVEDDERVKIELDTYDTETNYSSFGIFDVTNGGETTWHVDDGEFTYIGEPGATIRLLMANVETVAEATGQLVVTRMPVVDGFTTNPFAIGAVDLSGIPNAIANAIPRLLPDSTQYNGGSGFVVHTGWKFYFAQGLRPWFGGSAFVRDLMFILKYTGGINLGSVATMSTSIQLYTFTSGSPVLFSAVSDVVSAITPGLIWPSFCGYMAIDDELLPSEPVMLDMRVTHGSGVVIPNLGTLGYYIVRGND